MAFSFDPTRVITPQQMKLDVESAEARRSADPGPLERLFFSHDGRPVSKWVHYLPFYDRVLAPYRGRPVRMLEIGVMHGGSLELWRRYFGPDATLFGVDINPECAGLAEPPTQVRIGSQDDPAFMRGVVAEMGGVDIVLDDGSHVAQHQRTSFTALWPLLNPGGVYMIEDMHTSYWPKWEGGFQRPGTAVELIKQLVDDMHGWFSGVEEQLVRKEEIGGIEIGDSIAAVRKVPDRLSPGHIWSGGGLAL